MKAQKVWVFFLVSLFLFFNFSWSKSKEVERIERFDILSKRTMLRNPVFNVDLNSFANTYSGPDGYGYTYLDSDDFGGPTFNWIEISSSGMQVTSWYSRYDYDEQDDGTAGPFSIGFDFAYNGQTFNQIYIGTNGAVSFTQDTLTDGGYFYNAWIPGMRFSDVVAPFWNDLNLNPSSYGGGAVYYWSNSSDSFVVQYDKVKPWVESSTSDVVTFELILCKEDSSINCQYKNVKTQTSGTNLDSAALIGIQDQSMYSGLRYYGRGYEGYDNKPDSGLAVKFKKTQDINHNVLPGKIVSFGYPYSEYYDQPPALLWYLKETGSSFSDNHVYVFNTGKFIENDILVWSDLSRRDTLGNYTSLYTQVGSVSGLGSGSNTSVLFPPSWIPMERGEYYLIYRTELSGDEVAGDDTLGGLLFAERDLLSSSWATSVPVCDGSIDPGEWDDACCYDISKFYLNPYTVDCPQCYDSNAVFVYIKNDSSALYFALDVVKDTSDSEHDWTIIGMDDDASGSYNSNYSEGRYELRNASGTGTDSLIFWPFKSYSTYPYGVEDVGSGAIFLSGDFAQRENNGHQQIELALFLGTTYTYELNSTPGDTVMAYLGYSDSKDTCTVSSETIGNMVGYWPFRSIFDFYPPFFGEIYLSDAPSVPDKPVLVFPPNGTGGGIDQNFLWEPAARATSYQLQIDSDSSFSSPFKDTTTQTNGCFVSGLPGSRIWWRVRGINAYGYSLWSDSADYTDVEIAEQKDVITGFSLSQNYPNPFNPTTLIPFTVSYKRQEASRKTLLHTTLTIYNVLGQKVRTLVDEVKLPGEHRVVWDGKDDKGDSVSSGIYFYKLKSGDFVQVKKMLLLR